MELQDEDLAKLTDDEAIDNVYSKILNRKNLYNLFQRYVLEFDTENAQIAPDGSVKVIRKPIEIIDEKDPRFNQIEMHGKGVVGKLFEIKKIGNLAFNNPGAKRLGSILNKLKRITPISKEKGQGYNQNESTLLDSVNDWSRFSIILPNYACAPALVAYLLGEFGGEVKIRDEKHGKDGSYESIHLNFQYKGVNVEIQLHTQKSLELKKATDIFYHSYIEFADKDPELAKQLADERSVVSIEREQLRRELVKYSQVVYRHTDFRENADIIESMYKDDFFGKGAKPKRVRKLSQFCLYTWKAEMVQRELAEKMPKILADFQKMQNITLDFEKQSVAK